VRIVWAASHTHNIIHISSRDCVKNLSGQAIMNCAYMFSLIRMPRLRSASVAALLIYFVLQASRCNAENVFVKTLAMLQL
jgi:hypothetical protein